MQMQALKNAFRTTYREVSDTSPKKPINDQSFYAMAGVAVASYMESGKIEYLFVGMALYLISYMALRFNSQIQESKRIIEETSPGLPMPFAPGVVVEEMEL